MLPKRPYRGGLKFARIYADPFKFPMLPMLSGLSSDLLVKCIDLSLIWCFFFIFVAAIFGHG